MTARQMAESDIQTSCARLSEFGPTGHSRTELASSEMGWNAVCPLPGAADLAAESCIAKLKACSNGNCRQD